MSTAAPPTAKIVRFHRTGGPEVLQLDELPLPEPAAGEVRLRVKAIGLNRAEVLFRMGRYLVQPILPSKIGYEASGTVEAAGPDVDPSWIGKTVSTVPAFLASAYGVYGEVAIVPVSAIAEYPGRLSYEEGTSIWMQYLTAYGALIHQGRLAKGDFVLKQQEYKCQIDSLHKSFITKAGLPYMEKHHLISMMYYEEYENDLDDVSNIVSLCPNCHRQIHLGRKDDIGNILDILFKKQKDKLTAAKLLTSIKDLKVKYGIV